MRFRDLALPAALLIAAAWAEDVRMDSEVSGHPGVTYEVLLKQVLPDLRRGEGDQSEFWVSQGVSIRDAEGGMRETEAVALAALQTAVLRHDGQDLLVVMGADDAASGWLAILAVYDTAPAVPKLIDAIDAGMDRTTTLGAAIALSEREGGMTVSGAHGNSNEYFETVQVLMLREAKLASVFYGGAYSLQVCGMTMKQAGALTAEPDPGKPYAALIYTITQDVKRPDEDCGEDGVERLPAGTMTARDVFHWDAATGKFIAATHEVEKLMGPE